MVTRYSTSEFSVDQRAAYWREINARYVGVDAEPSESTSHPFNAILTLGCVGAYQSFRMSTDRHSSFSVRARGRPGPAEEIFLCTEIRGRCDVDHLGTHARMGRGDIHVSDTASEVAVDFHEGATQQILRIPVSVASKELLLVRDISGLRIDGSCGPGAVAAELLCSYLRHANSLSEVQASRLFESLAGMLNMAALEMLGSSRSSPNQRAALRRRAVRLFIEENIGDPELSPERIANARGISRRYLDRLFEGEPLTVSQTIMRRRLLHARRELACPTSLDKSITDIAFDLGFSSPAHFSRAFKAAFGVSPSDVRSPVRQSVRTKESDDADGSADMA